MFSSKDQIIFFFSIVLLIMITLSGFIIGFMFFYQKKQSLYLRTIEKIKTEQESIILKAQIEVQESILKNISREIHDNIGLTLTLSKLHLNQLPQYTEQLQPAIILITKAISNLRNLSKLFNSEYVLTNGLIESIKKEIDFINSANKHKMYFELHGQPSFIESSRELLVFRAVQEIYNNAIKHSDAKVILTKIIYSVKNLSIEIKDNGKGFVYNEFSPEYSGLNNIKARINLLNGRFDIITKKELGTQITISIPLNN